MEVKATLKVINQADCPGRRGVTDGQTYQRMVGWRKYRNRTGVRWARANVQAGTYEQLTGIRIEACYYVIQVTPRCATSKARNSKVDPARSSMHPRELPALTSGK